MNKRAIREEENYNQCKKERKRKENTQQTTALMN
jgi:hypothetical protein